MYVDGDKLCGEYVKRGSCNGTFYEVANKFHL
jgi:hypothetical protein